MTTMHRLRGGLLAACVVVALGGCGGGGSRNTGGGGTPVPPTPPAPTPNRLPVFTSAASVNVAENTSGVFHTAVATDADSDALAYSLSGGADRDDFSITGAGALSFAASPDFERPADSDANNVYQIVVSVSDGKGSTAQTLSITATDVAESVAPTALPRFPPAAVWHQDISAATLHPQSASMIATLAGLGGFGFGRMQIDFSMHVVRAPANAPLRSIIGFPSSGDYYLPDCNAIGTQMPVPAHSIIS